MWRVVQSRLESVSGATSSVGAKGWLVGTTPEPAALEVVERLLDLGAGVHDERPVPGDRLADRLPAEQQHLHAAGARVLTARGFHGERVAAAEHGQVAGVDRDAFATDRAAPAEHVDEAVELGRPRDHRRAPGASVACTIVIGVCVDPGPLKPPTSPAMIAQHGVAVRRRHERDTVGARDPGSAGRSASWPAAG